MNRYILIRRLRGPAILLLIGVLALLHQTGVIEHFWHLFIPMLLILLGVLLLAERTAMATDETIPPYPGAGYPGAPYSGAPYYSGAVDPNAAPGTTPTQETAIVPSRDFGSDPNGGKQ
jgi:hypothetical protein